MVRYIFALFVSATPILAQDVCSVALQSNAFNTFDQTINNNVAFEKKEEICSRDYENSEEFRNSARSGGFSLSYAGFGLGASGGKSSGTGKVHFREESFCQASQDEFAQEYFSNTSVRVADVALRAWTDCIETTERNSLWLKYNIAGDGTGMTGTIYRTISSGPTTLKITSMQVHPSTLAGDVNCSIENQLWTVEDFANGAEVTTDTTSEIVACTKPSDKTIRVALGTDGGSLTWVEMPSNEQMTEDKADVLEAKFLAYTAVTNAKLERLSEENNRLRARLAEHEVLAVVTVARSRLDGSRSTPGVSFNRNTGIIQFPNPEGATYTVLVSDINDGNKENYLTETNYVHTMLSDQTVRIHRTTLDTGNRNAVGNYFTALILKTGG